MPACLTCTSDFPAATRGGRAQKFCSPPCRVADANSRRSTTRKGRQGVTNPQPLSTTPPTARPTVETSPTDAPATPSDRLNELMEKAHSRTGINAFELADLARLRGLSPWTPARLIMSKDYRP